MDSEIPGTTLPDAPQGYEAGSLNQRFFAFILDGMLVFVVYLILAFFLRVMFYADNSPIILYIAVDIAYHVFFWTRPRGQTPGKRYVNNRVIKLDGSRLTLRDALIRYGFYYVNTLLLGIGWLRMFWDREHRGGHDHAAGTVVVLFEPSATADTAPFRPRSLALGWIVFGIPAVTMMAALNWRRLGQPERVKPTLLLGLFVTLVLFVVINHPVLYHLLPEPVTGVLGIVFSVSVLYSVLVSQSQVNDYQVWRERNGGKPPTVYQTGRKTFGRIVVASIGVSIVYQALLVPLLVGVTTSLLPDFQYSDQTIKFAYPAGWWTSTLFDDVPFCQQSFVTCLIVGRNQEYSSPGVSFELERFTGPDVDKLSAEAFDEEVWAVIQAEDPTITLISRDVREIDGRVAVERRFQSGSDTSLYIFIRDGSGIYRFYAQGPTDLFNQQLSTLERIIASIEFATPK